MQDIDELPLAQWAEQLKQARTDANLDIASLAPSLMLSGAQLRGIEAGSLAAFHGPGYYLRAVEKYARRLNVSLDPPVTELGLTDSQIALSKVKNQPSADKLARRESLVLGADAMPHGTGRHRTGVWLAAIVLVLAGTGTWLALKEGWPGKSPDEPVIETSAETAVPLTQLTQPTQSEIQVVQPSEPSIVTVTAAEPADHSNPAGQLAIDNPVDHSPVTANNVSVANQSIAAQAIVASNATQATEVPIASESSPVAEPIQAAELAPVQTAPIVEEPAPDVFDAQFNADCWVEVRYKDGRVEQKVYQAGQQISIPVDQIDRLVFGNAQAVTASRAGQAFDVNSFTRGGNNVARISAPNLLSR